MNELVQQLSQRLGISEDKSRMAVDTVLSFLKTGYRAWDPSSTPSHRGAGHR